MPMPDPLTREAVERMLCDALSADELHAAVDHAVEWIEAHPTAGADRTELRAMLEVLSPVDAQTPEEARDHAIAYQAWAATQSLSWGEVAEWQGHFEELAERFDLTDEFRENGII